jgi:hypothetical protein
MSINLSIAAKQKNLPADLFPNNKSIEDLIVKKKIDCSKKRSNSNGGAPKLFIKDLNKE